MKKRRNIEAFSLSFLDCICCGFGAIVLLLVLSKLYDPSNYDLSNQSQELSQSLKEQLIAISNETEQNENELRTFDELIKNKIEELNLINAELYNVQGQHEWSWSDPIKLESNEKDLEEAKQRLSEEIIRLQPDYKRAANESIGGIPVDSEYIIFVIDTSGSMQAKWDWAERKLSEVLDVYPTVKGIQIMNDNGRFMFQQYGRSWLPDSPQLRQSIKNTMRQWAPFSDSDPSDGISYAIQSFWAPDKKISIYVFGDEFQGNSMEAVLNDIDRINIEDENGDRLVRIHAVGFPYNFGGSRIPQSSQRFAGLMRSLCERNGGTFVALTNDDR